MGPQRFPLLPSAPCRASRLTSLPFQGPGPPQAQPWASREGSASSIIHQPPLCSLDKGKGAMQASEAREPGAAEPGSWGDLWRGHERWGERGEGEDREPASGSGVGGGGGAEKRGRKE